VVVSCSGSVLAFMAPANAWRGQDLFAFEEAVALAGNRRERDLLTRRAAPMRPVILK
jgi:hypothetical protein